MRPLEQKTCCSTVMLFALLMTFLCPNTDDLRAQQNGSIRGKIELPPLPPSRNKENPPRYGSYAPAQSSGVEAKEQPAEATNVVVYLDGPGLENIHRDERRAVLDQRDATFIPHVLPIVKGTTVRIVNRDKTYHNVFSLSPVKKFNIGRRPTGEEAPVTFDKTGTVQVFCDIHSHMSAFILVLSNPLFVQPKPDGTFSLDDIPPGKYTIQAWHEHYTAPPQSVTVGAGETATVNFALQ